MPANPPKRNGLLQRLWGVIAPQSKPTASNTAAPLEGSQYTQIYGNSRAVRYSLEVDEIPVRCVNNNRELTIDLIEMALYCDEAKQSLFFLVRDTFQTQSGTDSSWIVPPEVTYAGETIKIHPEVVQIARELERRTFGKERVIGGDRLARMLRECLAYGDSFMELGIGKINEAGELGIVSSQYLPTFSVFVDESETSEQRGYWQRRSIQPHPDDIYLSPIKVLHCSHLQRSLYGQPLINVEAWRRYKKVAINLEEGSAAVGLNPWVHELPSEYGENEKRAYMQNINDLRQTKGIITDLFVLNGGSIAKASTDANALSSLIDHFTLERTSLIPPGIPSFLFPFLSNEGADKDRTSAPSLAYSRYINYLRGLLSNQIKWALNLEIILRKGYSWWQENGYFDVTWDPFISDVNSAMLATQDQLERQDDEPINESESSNDSIKRVLLDATRLINSPSLKPADYPELSLLQRYPNYSELHKLKSTLNQLIADVERV